MVEITPQKSKLNNIKWLKNNLKNHYHFIAAFGIVGIVFAAANFTNPPLFNNTDNFVLFASEEIKLEKEAQVSSGDLGSNKEIDIEKDAIINGDIFADKITLDKNVTINGNVSFNKIKAEKETKILGTQTKPVSLPIANLPEIPDFQIGIQDFKFEGQNNILPAGNYQNLTLEKNSRLTLTGGTYNLNKLFLKESSVLIFSAPVTLNIKEELKGEEHIAILPANNNLKPTDLTVNYQGKNEKDEPDKNDKNENQNKEEKADKEDNGVKPVEFGKNSFLNFKLLAPKASVHIEKESILRGQVLAKKIKVGKGGVMSREPTTIKVAKPEDIITDPNGGVYPINEILVSLIPSATSADAENIATVIGGRVVGVVSSINLYQIEVRTKTTSELESLINNLRTKTDLKIDGVFRDYIFPEQ